MNRSIAILGGGHGAHAMAADLCSRNFSVNLFEMPQFRSNLQKVFDTGVIRSSGSVQGDFQLHKVTSDIDDAIDGVTYILLVTPAFAHESYANLLKGKVRKDQVVIVYPGAFASLLMRRIFLEECGGDVNNCPVIAEFNNLPYDARVVAPAEVVIHGFNPVSVAFLPADKGQDLISEIRQIHAFERVYQDVLEAGLSIVNPAVHSGPCLFSISAIENSSKRPFFLYEHGVTPSGCKLNVSIDHERKRIGEALGYTLTPTEDFGGFAEGYGWKDVYTALHGNISLTPISGPHEISSRYFTEDAPFGLVPWSSIGEVIGVDTPTIKSVVNIYNVVHEKNWWEAGRTAADMGLSGMSLEQIKRYVHSGMNDG